MHEKFESFEKFKEFYVMFKTVFHTTISIFNQMEVERMLTIILSPSNKMVSSTVFLVSTLLLKMVGSRENIDILIMSYIV